jgi:hypothetical protein
MSEFLVEVFVPQTRSDRMCPPPADVDAVLEQLAREGHPISLTGSVLVPEDETRFLLFRAGSREEVSEAAIRLGLRCDRISEAVSDWAPR